MLMRDEININQVKYFRQLSDRLSASPRSFIIKTEVFLLGIMRETFWKFVNPSAEEISAE